MAEETSMISDFEAFLIRCGPKLVAREAPEYAMGYRLIEYASEELRVRLVHEKGFWDLLLADNVVARDTWYSLNSFTYLLEGPPQPRMAFEEQLDYARNHWVQIAEAFTPSRRNETQVRLDAAKKERLRDMFEIWPTLVLDLESYLTRMGLVCTYRKKTQFLGDTMVVQYSGSGIAVRMSSQTRWDVEFADLHRDPDRWYRFGVILQLLQGPDNKTVTFPGMFDFVKVNWERIVSAFSESVRDETHARLGKIEQSWPPEGKSPARVALEQRLRSIEPT